MADQKKEGFYCGDSGDETKHDAAHRREDERRQPLRDLNDREGTDEFPEPD